MSGSAECRNQPPRGKRAQWQLLIGLTTRSPERERRARAFLLTKTYMDAGDSAQDDCVLSTGVGTGHESRRARSPLAVVVVSPRAVVAAATQTAILEICVPNHKGRDHFGPTSQRALYPRVQRGNPRFTFVSEGKPLRRLLVVSYRNSSFTAFLLPDGFARDITEEEDYGYCKPDRGLRRGGSEVSSARECL
jgi:hypothetical protein